MKKLIVGCSMLVTLCLSLMVVNLFRTREISRINAMEEGLYSQKFYVYHGNRSSEELLTELERLSQRYQVSFVKTSQDRDTVIKAALIFSPTFPSSNFGLQQVTFADDPQGVYANTPVARQLGTIKTFMQAKKIELMSLENYFADPSRSVNGSYTIASTYPYDKVELLGELSAFFDVSMAALTEAKVVSTVGYVNQDLILIGGVLVLALLLLIVGATYYPLFHLHSIGVRKLLGFTNCDIFLTFSLPIFGTIIGTALLFDIVCWLWLDTFPQYFFMSLLWGQVALLLLYGLASLLLYSLVQGITVAKMLKGFSKLKLIVYLNYSLKLCFIALLALGLVPISQILGDMQHQVHEQKEWDKRGKDYLTIDYIKPSEQLWEAMLSDTAHANHYFETIFHQLEQETNTLYIKSEDIDVASRFALTGWQRPVSIMTVNRHYLASLKFDFPETSSHKLFFVHRQMASHPQIIDLLQHFYHSQLSYEEQEKVKPTDLSVQLAVYDNNLSLFPYSQRNQGDITNPIFSVLSDHLLFEEAAYLSNTGISNPIKIPKGRQNLKLANQIVNQQGDGSRIKFSSLYEIQQDMVDSLGDSLKHLTYVIGLLSFLSIMLTYFTVAVLFICRRRYLTTMKFLGWTMYDRYRPMLLVLGLGHMLALGLVASLSHQLSLVSAYVVYFVLDMTLCLLFALRNENSKVSQQLKRGVL